MEKKYTTYNEIDFAEEPSFIRWVQGKDQRATAFWKKWTAAHPEKKEAIKAAKTLVNAIQIKEEEPAEARIKNLWSKIDAATVEEIKPKQETATVRTLGRRQWLSYAAAACVGLLAFFYFYNPTTTIDIGNGEQLAYVLPDNSKVDLNAGSKITFKSRSFEGERIVNLEGEAFFEVEKGTSFKVMTPNGMIEVLGTRFNVNTRNGNLVVDCEEGKVRVTANGNAQILTEGLGTKLNKEKSALVDAYTSNVANQTSWRTGNFHLVQVPLQSALEEIERQF